MTFRYSSCTLQLLPTPRILGEVVAASYGTAGLWNHVRWRPELAPIYIIWLTPMCVTNVSAPSPEIKDNWCWLYWLKASGSCLCAFVSPCTCLYGRRANASFDSLGCSCSKVSNLRTFSHNGLLEGR